MHKISVKLFVPVLGLSLLGFSPCCFSQDTASNYNQTAGKNQVKLTPAAKFIQTLGNKAINILSDKSITVAERQPKYFDFLLQAFDMRAIGRFVLGRAWKSATPEQLQEYMKLFETLVVKIYGDRLNLYTGEELRVKGVRSESDADSIVLSEVTHTGGAAATHVDWRVRQEGGKFFVIDVVVEGVSQSVTQRDEYADILQRNNGSLDALLAVMRDKSQQITPP